MTVQGATLREQLEANYDKIIAPQDTTVETTVATEAPVTTTETAPAATTTATPAAEVPAKLGGETPKERARHEDGTFAKEQKEKADKAKREAAGKPAAPVVEEKIGVKRPDSWKKETWAIWDKLDAGQPLTREERKLFLEYLPEREGQYLKGVSAYKAQWDRAKPLLDALTPYQRMIETNKMRPEQFVTALAATHQTLTEGSPQDKLRAFAKFAQDYQIPVHELFIQGEDGRLYFNTSLQPKQEPPKQLTVEEVKRQVLAEMQHGAWMNAIKHFAEAKTADGQAVHPHFEAVRGTMDGLLRAGISKDLKSAYEAALRLPAHSALAEAMDKDAQAKAQQAKAKEEAERVARARANATQSKTQAPTGQGTEKGAKGLRAQLEASYDQHVAGRI